MRFISISSPKSRVIIGWSACIALVIVVITFRLANSTPGYYYLLSAACLLLCLMVVLFFTLSEGQDEKRLQVTENELEQNLLQRTAKLQQSEKRFRAMVEHSAGVTAMLDENISAIYLSQSAEILTGYSLEDGAEKFVMGNAHPADRYQLQNCLKEVKANPGKVFRLSFRFKHKKGHYIWLEATYINFLNDLQLQGIIVNMQDVSERKKAAQKLVTAKRLYLFSSQVNQMIVKATDQAALFREACRIAVETGKFRMAWVGLIDVQNNSLLPVVHMGEADDYLSRITIANVEDQPEGRGPTGVALREGRPVFCNDIEHEPEMSPWREAAVDLGYRSSISLPIQKFGKVIGAFSLYADTINFFNKEEIEVLLGCTCDISFALELFEKEQLRRNAEDELSKSRQRYQTLAEVSPVGIFHTDSHGATNYVNPRWCAISGLSYEEATGNGWLNAVHVEDRVALAKNWEKDANTQSTSVAEYRFVRPDGSIAWVLGEATAERDAGNQVVGFVGTITDITEIKKTENEILNEKKLSDSIINSLPGVFYMYDRDGKFLRWNKNFEAVTKYNSEEISGMHPLDFFDGNNKKKVAQKIDNTFRHGEDHVEADFQIKTHESIPYYFTGKAIEYNGSKTLLGVGIDFSEREAAQRKINETTKQLRQLTAHLQSIREEERKRIGREIHDDLGQQLTAIKMDISWIDKNMPEEWSVLKMKLKNVTTLLDGSNQSLRRILSELRPIILDNHGLVEAMEWIGSELTADSAIAFHFTGEDETDLLLPEPIATCIFRVYQEALTNIIRYAGPCDVFVSLKVIDGSVVVNIADTGRGFDFAAIKSNQSFGILGMQERVLSNGGEFELITAPGEGTKITMCLPLV